MEIQLFQLENLFSNPNRFLFFDIRSERAGVPDELEIILGKALAKPGAEVLGHLQELKVQMEFPIVLVCENGQASERLARHLEDGGFTNVYVVAGGVIGLLSEL